MRDLKIHLLNLANFIILGASFLFSLNVAKHYSYILFAIQLIIFYVYLYQSKRLILFLTPIMLLIAYVDVSFALGNFAFGHEIIAIRKNYWNFLGWKYTHYLTSYVLLQNTILFYIDLFFHQKYLKRLNEKIQLPSDATMRRMLVISAVFYFIFSIVPIDLAFFGGLGDVSIIPRTVSALVFIYFLASRKIKYRHILYALILLVFSVFSYENKREAILLMAPIAFIEVIYNYAKISFRILMLSIVSALILVVLILGMSVIRGDATYEEFVRGRFKDSVLYIPPKVIDYVKSENFLAYFFLNIETNYTYYHSMQAMEYIQEDLGKLSFGSTIIKVLFIGIPSSICSFKPKSFIHLYTMTHAPIYRLGGGSWAANIYAEAFWNFYFFGIIYILIIFFVLSQIFMRTLSFFTSGKMIKNIWLLYAYMQILSFARGSGLDLYMIEILISVAFVYVFKFIETCFSKQKIYGDMIENPF